MSINPGMLSRSVFLIWKERRQRRQRRRGCNLILILWRWCYSSSVGIDWDSSLVSFWKSFLCWIVAEFWARGVLRPLCGNLVAMAMASLIVAPSALSCSASAFFTPVPVSSAAAATTSSSAPVSLPTIVCGRGDRRTAKGKRSRGSFGNCRPKDSSKGTGLALTPLPPRPKKDESADTEYIHVDIDETLFN